MGRKPNMSFLASILICNIGLLRNLALNAVISEFAISCSYFYQNLFSINHVLIYIFYATKHIISFLASILQCDIGLKRYKSSIFLLEFTLILAILSYFIIICYVGNTFTKSYAQLIIYYMILLDKILASQLYCHLVISY